jgi:hypothetical protein
MRTIKDSEERYLLYVTQYGSCKSVYLRNVFQLLVTANIPSLLILLTLMMEAIRSSET